MYRQKLKVTGTVRCDKCRKAIDVNTYLKHRLYCPKSLFEHQLTVVRG